jgi:hypothetical protein
VKVPLARHNPAHTCVAGWGFPMLTKLTLALTALAFLVAPAKADCARASAMCEWPAVEEWLEQQRADAEARLRAWQLFGPQPSAARIEQVRQWLVERR